MGSGLAAWYRCKGPGCWPPSALITVGVLAVATCLLAISSLQGATLGSGAYDAEISGSLADWFAGIAAFLAVPIALWINSRDHDLDRKAFAAAQQERHERSEHDRESLRNAVRLEVTPIPLADLGRATTETERASVVEWREEMRRRGWAPSSDEEDTWSRDGVTRTTGELADEESTAVLPKPWVLVAICRNHSAEAVRVGTITVDTRSGGGAGGAISSPLDLPPGEVGRARVVRKDGKRLVFASSSKATQYCKGVTAIVEGVSGGPFVVSGKIELTER